MEFLSNSNPDSHQHFTVSTATTNVMRQVYSMRNLVSKPTIQEIVHRLDLAGSYQPGQRYICAPVGIISYGSKTYDLVLIGRTEARIALFNYYDEGPIYAKTADEMLSGMVNSHELKSIFESDPDSQFVLSFNSLVFNYLENHIHHMDFPVYLRRLQTIEESAVRFLQSY
ncbi:hypothetical protein G7032_20030 [Pseudomonas monteilii]|uniref:hypothetical protein n=1 Tax=Pseudomonas TaxID=286 RepID=UPI0015E35673|nr:MULTISPECIES: hypothetical protein [Pseudomonas]MBA1318141.1 hypothetical protein [Pseudomonas monteilii]MDC3841681.1 hypothetical protein [Pseudomonas aeruginosa]